MSGGNPSTVTQGGASPVLPTLSTVAGVPTGSVARTNVNTASPAELENPKTVDPKQTKTFAENHPKLMGAAAIGGGLAKVLVFGVLFLPSVPLAMFGYLIGGYSGSMDNVSGNSSNTQAQERFKGDAYAAAKAKAAAACVILTFFKPIAEGYQTMKAGGKAFKKDQPVEVEKQITEIEGALKNTIEQFYGEGSIARATGWRRYE